MMIHGIILLSFKAELALYGKKMWEWVARSCDTSKAVELSNNDILSAVKGGINSDSKYTAVLYSDAPLIQKSTITEAIGHLESAGLNAVKLPRGYVFKTDYLSGLSEIPNLTTFYCGDDDFIYAPDYSRLAVVSDILRRRITEFHLKNGVYIVDPSTVYIDSSVSIEAGVTIMPFNTLRGSTVIYKGAVLEQGNIITSSVIKGGASVSRSDITSSHVGENTTVGPFAFLRAGSHIGSDCRIGDYVEIKNAKIGKGTKVAHLSYIGDAEVGVRCNIGCGTVFVNYDGKNKHKTVVGNGVFIGSNSNLVAPLRLEDGAFIAAGSTITEDIPSNALAIARARQSIKENWNKGRY